MAQEPTPIECDRCGWTSDLFRIPEGIVCDRCLKIIAEEAEQEAKG